MCISPPNFEPTRGRSKLTVLTNNVYRPSPHTRNDAVRQSDASPSDRPIVASPARASRRTPSTTTVALQTPSVRTTAQPIMSRVAGRRSVIDLLHLRNLLPCRTYVQAHHDTESTWPAKC